MKTKILCIILSLVLLFGILTACGGDVKDVGSADSSEEFLYSEESFEANVSEEYLLGMKSFTATEGEYTAPGFTVLCDNEELKDRAQKLFSKSNRELSLSIDSGFTPEGAPEAVLDQAYKIEVGDSVKVTARGELGLYYGAQTVSHYLKLQGGMYCGTYVDWPDVAERTLHLDVARKYFTKDWIMDLIEDISAFKMNALELHFSENEGFRIQCDTDPAIMSDEYLTKDEVREIIAYAEELYVEIIPSFDSPGHVKQILKAHPEYMLIDVDGYASEKTLDITNPEAVAYIKSLLDEYAELFKDCKQFNIGGDESFGWSDVRRMQFSAWQILEDYAKATYGSDANAHDAFVGYINDIAAHMKAKGFKVRAWNDGLIRNLDQAEVNKASTDIGVCYWTNNGTLSATVVTPYINGGYDVYNVNEAFMYYVLKAGFKQPNAREIYNKWHSGYFTGGSDKGTNPNKYETPYEVGEQLKGAYFCIWCDHPDAQTEDQVKSGSRSALRAMAVKAWNYAPKVDYNSFLSQAKKVTK